MRTHQKPTIGRIVHYRSRGSADGVFKPECRAAVVTEVGTIFCVSLAVLNPSGMFFDADVTHIGQGEKAAGGSWHWHTECEECTSP